MPNHDETADFSAAKINKTPLDYFALAVSTCAVGYLPFAPGTYGSIVGAAVYLLFGWLESLAAVNLAAHGWTAAQTAAWTQVFNLILFGLYCVLGVWAASRTAILLGKKDPQKVVVDEVVGQLIVFLFVPFDAHWYFVLAGFGLFRLFDIWKPSPIRALENLPQGLGICADDMLAGIYGGVCLSVIYAVFLMF